MVPVRLLRHSAPLRLFALLSYLYIQDDVEEEKPRNRVWRKVSCLRLGRPRMWCSVSTF